MAATKKKNARLITIILLVAILFGGARIYFMQRQMHTESVTPQNPAVNVKITGTIFPDPKVIAPFSLNATDGTIFTNDRLQGHWTLLFFGFTRCADVCPTTLASLNQMMVYLKKRLPKALLPQVVLVSVDPERDTLAELKSYVHTFNPQFLGARTDLNSLAQFTKPLGISYKKISMPIGDYTVQHSAEILIVDPKGEWFGLLSYPHQGLQMAQDYTAIQQAMQPNRN